MYIRIFFKKCPFKNLKKINKFHMKRYHLENFKFLRCVYDKKRKFSFNFNSQNSYFPRKKCLYCNFLIFNFK